MSAKLSPLLRYLDGLTSPVDLGVLGEHLQALSITPEDVAQFCHFGENAYKRNPVQSANWYELLVMCWRPGQASQIHDHAGTNCGVKILTGTLTEIRFESAGLSSTGKNRARATGEGTLECGEVCLAADGTIHQIVNASPSEDLITLHLYSPPPSYEFLRGDRIARESCAGAQPGTRSVIQRVPRSREPYDSRAKGSACGRARAVHGRHKD